VTIAAAALAGGRPWAQHLAAPLAFVLTGLLWPTPVNLWISTNLAGFDARIAADIVSAAGHPALVTGNVIAVGNGLVNIDEACSGLRSLQAAGMIGFFFGEFFMLNWPRRVGLFAAALAIALASNMGRTAFLTWQVAAHGIAAEARWHDRAGGFELVATLALSAALSVRLAWSGRSRGVSPESRPALGPRTRSGTWPWVVMAGAAAAIVGTQAWYLGHEWRAPAETAWTLVIPDSSWQPSPVPEQAQAVLGNTTADGLAWQDAVTGTRAWAYLIAWRGDAAHGENPEWHDPTVCLPASGGRMVRELGKVSLRIDGVPLVFSAYRFMIAGRSIATFFCHWDAELDQSRAEFAADPGIRWRRLERVMDGRRNGDVAHLTLEIETRDDREALDWFRTWAPRVLHPVPLRHGQLVLAFPGMIP
jgi:exosortase